MALPITEEQIARLVAAWYLALDRHDPVEDVYELLADPGLVMSFPDGKIHDLPSFKEWYDRVTHLFFDENHLVQAVNCDLRGDTAILTVSVGWQASFWEPPAAKSKRVSLDAKQKWTVRRSTKNAYGLEIASYDATAEPFQYAPGFARL